jgi:hypothetical protein
LIKLSDEVLEQLVDAKVVEGTPWYAMPELYEQLTGERITEQTLRKVMLRQAPMEFVSSHTSQSIRRYIEDQREEIHDVFWLMKGAFNLRFREFYELQEKRYQATLDEKTEFTRQDAERMDMIFNEMTAFTFRLSDVLKDVRSDALDELMPERKQTVESEEGTSLPGAIQKAVEETASKTAEAMSTLMAHHKAEQRGHFRPIPDAEPDEDLIDG